MTKNSTSTKKDAGDYLFGERAKMVASVIGYLAIALLAAWLAAGFVTLIFVNL